MYPIRNDLPIETQRTVAQPLRPVERGSTGPAKIVALGEEKVNISPCILSCRKVAPPTRHQAIVRRIQGILLSLRVC